MKKLFTFFLALAASVGTIHAEVYSGTCGDYLTWSLNTEDSTLTISGTGAMTSYDWRWWYSSYIKSVIISEGCTSIERFAFYDCPNLTSVTIPNSVTCIGESAFDWCLSLTSVTIPSSVTSIGESAFGTCGALTSIDVETSNPNYCSVDGVLFNKDKTTLIQYPIGKQGAYTIPNSVTDIGNYAFCNGIYLTSVEIPNSVTSIGKRAFFNCIITSVEIPNSVTSIDGAFVDCRILTSINVEVTNPKYCSVDGVLFNKDQTTLIQYPAGKQGAYIIPSSVTSVGDEAFHYCSSLTSIEIPNSVTNIGNIAFSGCSGLTSVMIPNSVTSIGSSAFSSCTSLTSITCEAATPPTCGEYVFEEVDKSIPLYVPAQSVAAYQAADGWKDFSNIIGIDDEDVNIRYIDPSENELGAEAVTLHLPDAPEIDGFTFLKWQVVAGDLEDGITLQAIYEASNPTEAPAVYTSPANPAQKLIRNGNVYLLYGEKKYTMMGQEVR